MRISDWSSDVFSSDLKTSLGDGRGKDFHRSRTVAAAVHLCVNFKNPSPALALLRLGSRVHLCVQRKRKGESWNIVSWDRRDFAFPHCAFEPERSAVRGSEERRVGKECVCTCRSRWGPAHIKKH